MHAFFPLLMVMGHALLQGEDEGPLLSREEGMHDASAAAQAVASSRASSSSPAQAANAEQGAEASPAAEEEDAEPPERTDSGKLNPASPLYKSLSQVPASLSSSMLPQQRTCTMTNLKDCWLFTIAKQQGDVGFHEKVHGAITDVHLKTFALCWALSRVAATPLVSPLIWSAR